MRLRCSKPAVKASITSKADCGSGTMVMDMMEAALVEMREAYMLEGLSSGRSGMNVQPKESDP